MAGDKELNSSVKGGSHCNYGSDASADKSLDKDVASSFTSKIDQALDQSVKELEMLEKFYQQRGKIDRAGEISVTLRRMRGRSSNASNSADIRPDGH